ncbi:MAG TPA: protein translocase subunit SecD, partial [Arenimonas sp.]|nr:protein translocase subunit SecD [Arenimonas sp.]
MLDFSKWKYALVFMMLVFSTLYFVPNLFPQEPAVQISANRGGQINSELQTRVATLLKENKVDAKSVTIEKNNLLVRLSNTDQQIKVSDILRPELGSGYTVALNLANTVPAWLSAIGAKPMTLGLDLQGGVHFLMQVDQQAAMEKRENAYADEIRGSLRDNKSITSYDVTRSKSGIQIVFKSEPERSRAKAALSIEYPKLEFIDLPNSNQLGLLARVTVAEAKTIADGAIEQNVTTLRNRINALGV